MLYIVCLCDGDVTVMPKQSKKFTEKFIQALPIMEKEYSRSDDGLRVRVYPSGKKKFSYYVISPDGRRATHKIGEYPSINLKTAKAIASKHSGSIVSKASGLFTNDKGITFGDYIESDAYQAVGRKRSSHQVIMDNLRSVVPQSIHNTPLKLITPEQINSFIDSRTRAGKLSQTVNKNITNIRSVFKQAFVSGLVESNIMDRVKSLDIKDAKEKLALTPDERQRLIKAVNNKTSAGYHQRMHLPIYVALGLDTGLRTTELLELKWSDFNNENKITENVQIQGVKTNYQIANQVIAQSINDEDDKLDEKQIINDYGASKRTLTVIRFYPSIDQTTDDHQNVKSLSLALRENGYQLKVDDSRKWYVTVDMKYKSKGSRTVAVSSKTIKKVKTYLIELYKYQIQKDVPDGYVLDGFDDCCNPLVSEDKDKQTKKNLEGYALLGWMDNKYLFPSPSNESHPVIKSVKTSFSTLIKKAGLSKAITPHTLRHEFVSDLARKDTSPFKIQRLAGHNDIKTTMKYVHAVEKLDFSAQDKADRNRKR